MKARIQWAGEAMFLGESGSGHVVVMDGPPEAGGRNLAPRPMEMVLVGTGGCTLGVQQATGAVTLCGRIAIDDTLGGESLAALLGGFVDTAAFWKAFVEGTPEGDGGTLLPPSFAMRA